MYHTTYIIYPALPPNHQWVFNDRGERLGGGGGEFDLGLKLNNFHKLFLFSYTRIGHSESLNLAGELLHFAHNCHY